MKFIKKMKDVLPVHDLRYLLHTHLHTADPHRGLEHIHASELTKEDGFCPRMYCLADLVHSKLPDRWLTTSDNVTFHIGRVLQDSVVTWFAEMGRAVGHWRCLSCGQVHQFQKRPGKCGCGSRGFRPQEVRFESAVSGASCGIDMLFNNDGPKLRVVEIKTMAPEQFKELKGPLGEHRQRTTLYLRIVAESTGLWKDLIDTSVADVLYVSKNGYGVADPQLKAAWGLYEGFSPFKLYRVPRDDALVEKESTMARAVTRFRAGEAGMPTGICPTALSKRAHLCPLRAACFSGQYPPQVDWQGGHET